MDYEDYKAGFDANSFWFRGKRNLLDILLSKHKKYGNLKILSVGTGTGDELKILKKYGEIYVIDHKKEVLDLIPEGVYVEKRVCDICELPHKDNTFDIVVALDVLEYIPKHIVALKQIKRVLKKEGIFIFTIPAHPFLFGPHDKQLGHVRRYRKKGVIEIFKKYELFRSWDLHYWNSILLYPTIIIRLLKKNAKPKLDEQTLPKVLDSIFFQILNFENKLVKNNIYSPLGLSIFGICKK